MKREVKFKWLPVTSMPDGSDLRLPLHVLKGAKDGPTLGLSAAVHGNEMVPSVGTIQRVLELLDPAELSGTVMAVPICNPLGVGQRSRHTLGDGMDLNNAFPKQEYGGPQDVAGSVTEQTAAVLIEEFLAHLDYHIDFHTGGESHCVHSIDYADDPVVFGMARAFNLPILMRDYWLPEQIWGMSERLGVKIICAECGGGGQLYDEWLERNVRGTFNVMRELGMLPGKVEVLPRQYVVDRTKGNEHNLRVLLAREAGLLVPDPAITAWTAFSGEPVEGAPVLGRLLNMYDLTIRQEFKAPFQRTLMLATVVGPSWFYPGSPAYLLADAGIAEVLD